MSLLLRRYYIDNFIRVARNIAQNYRVHRGKYGDEEILEFAFVARNIDAGVIQDYCEYCNIDTDYSSNSINYTIVIQLIIISAGIDAALIKL